MTRAVRRQHSAYDRCICLSSRWTSRWGETLKISQMSREKEKARMLPYELVTANLNALMSLLFIVPSQGYIFLLIFLIFFFLQSYLPNLNPNPHANRTPLVIYT